MSADLLAAFGDNIGDTQSGGTTSEFRPQPVTNASIRNEANDSTSTKGILKVNDHASAKLTSLWERDASGTEILFDATEEGEEFGEFQDIEVEDEGLTLSGRPKQQTSASKTIKPYAKTTKSIETVDLLGLNNDDNDSHSDTGLLVSPSGVSHSTNHLEHTLQEYSISKEENDDWGEFEKGGTGDTEQSTSIHREVDQNFVNISTQAQEPIEEDWGSIDDWETPLKTEKSGPPPDFHDQYHKPSQSKSNTRQASTISQITDRPTNVPPPAILLGLLPLTFQHLTDTTNQDGMSISERAERILSIFRVSGRILAGRSVRWKRDAILAQSTKIGQAGKSGGMKLSAVNKGEGIREEREAAEAVDAWSRQASQFSSVLLRAKKQHPQLKLSVSMPIKASMPANTPNARQVCPICGLKRSERTSGVDEHVEDLFGEFWIENWGHKDCSDFWYEYRSQLSQR